jgi:DNA-binding transcriptional LysR family regulator
LETIQSLVRAGLGISLIPAMAARRERDRTLEYRSLHSPKPCRQIVALWAAQRPPGRAAIEFLEAIRAKSRHAAKQGRGKRKSEALK